MHAFRELSAGNDPPPVQLSMLFSSVSLVSHNLLKLLIPLSSYTVYAESACGYLAFNRK
jgi:hypothetical protein